MWLVWYHVTDSSLRSTRCCRYAQITNNPENDGCVNAVLLV
jgi:ribosomal protein S8E